MKWILIFLAVAAAAFGAWQWKNGNQSAPMDSANIASFAPADTAYFISANTDQAMADFFAGYYIAGSPGKHAQFLQMGIDLTEEKSSPAMAYAHFLMNKFQQERDGTLGSFFQFFGLSTVGESAFFSHGLMPVIKMPIANKETLLTLLKEASQASGLESQSLTIGDKTAHTWALPDLDDGTQLSAALYVDDQYATLSVIRQSDADNVKQERLGMTLPQNSLATSKEVENINKHHNFVDYSSGFIHFQRIAEAFLEPEKTLLGRELNELILGKNDIAVTAECREDYAMLAKSLPRWIFGYSNLEISGDKLDMTGNSIFEMTSDPVKAELQKMRGHIAEHAKTSDDKLFSIAYGVDIGQVTPALTALWTQLTQQTFSCPQLVEMQEQAQQQSPAMLGMMLGMVQGIKGVALSLYDIQFENSPMPSDLSALLSITANNPASVASLTSMAPIPQLAQLQIPSDGTPVDLPLPMLPPGVEVKTAIKGKHLVVYLGEKGKSEAERMTNESDEVNGVFGVGFNYDKLAELAKSPAMNQFGMLAGGAGGCAVQLEIQSSFSQISGSFYLSSDHGPDGVELDFEGTMNKPAYPQHKIAGNYLIEDLDELCQWQQSGTTTFTGSEGKWTERDFSDECNLFEETFSWSQSNATLTMTPNDTQFRESCGDTLEKADPANAEVCYMDYVTENSFICTFDIQDEMPALVRYTKQ